MRLDATGEVRVREQVWLYGAQFVTYPSEHAMMRRIGYIPHQAVECAIARSGPVSNLLRPMTNCSKQIEPGKPCPPHNTFMSIRLATGASFPRSSESLSPSEEEPVSRPSFLPFFLAFSRTSTLS